MGRTRLRPGREAPDGRRRDEPAQSTLWTREGLMSHSQKIPLAFGEHRAPDLRLVIAWDPKLLHQQPDDGLD